MTDQPTYATYRFIIELELPSTPDSPVNQEEVVEELKAVFDENTIPEAKSIEIFSVCEGPCFGVLTPDMLDDLTDETLRMMIDAIEEEVEEGPTSYSREDMIIFLKAGMKEAQEEKEKYLH